MDERTEAAALPLVHALIRDGQVDFSRPLHVRIHAVPTGNAILIEGSLDTCARLICSRCLEPFEFEMETDFSATAVPSHSISLDSESREEIELRADDMDVIPYTGESIDLGEEIAQQMIMALPFKPICDDNCRGLCNQCGVNLNKETCSCRSGMQNSPFAVLKSLNLPAKKE
ncbi:YceD family protein [Desulfosarcina ovata]|uniref:DUF177 domain-containing protein n=1 Tax=Desulfosarcina ovata subsp. ovata TaxID=2752305 RepID=A0A5K8A4Z3_9BACT|nr:DUF177 domain-containing protein [Desulfosarcina ovata]BBO87360.1 hypothetical protein DSCOOX_05400 [Desulfosarcina ovata subsp. ovata]